MREYAAACGELHIVSRAPAGAQETHEGPLHLYPVHGSKLLTLLMLAGVARRVIERNGIEIVSAQDPFEHGFIAMKAIRGTNAKLHIQVHTDFLSPWFVRSGVYRSAKVRGPLMNRVRVWLAGKVLPHADGIRAVSKRVSDSISARYGNTVPVPTIIPIAVDATLPAKAELPPHEFGFALITVGRLEPEKRIEDILHALARTGHAYQSAGLVVVGEGSERPRLEAIVRALGLQKRVVFTGWRTDSLALMQSAQAYIQASAYEGYGRTLVEAALARIPIITTDVGIVGEVFRGYAEVLSAPPGDPAALATHIQGLVEDHQARALFVDAAERAARAHLESVGNLAEAIRRDFASLLV